MHKKKYKTTSNSPYKKKKNAPEKLYGYVIDVDDLITAHPEPIITEDIDYIDITNEHKLIG